MSDLLAEVDEAMRQEKLAKFWHEYGTSIIISILATILFTAGFSGYNAWDNNTKAKQTQEIITLAQSPEFPQNVLDESLELRPSMRGITLLIAAGEFMNADDRDNALKTYTKLIEDTKIPDDFRHLGILMQARIDPNEETIQNLKTIFNSDSPWKPHAYIDAAMIAAQNGEIEKAKTYLNAVAAIDHLPESLYTRAKKIEQTLIKNDTQ